MNKYMNAEVGVEQTARACRKPVLARLGHVTHLTAAGSNNNPSENNSASGCVDRTKKINAACIKP